MFSGVYQFIIGLGIVILIKSVLSEKITAEEYALLPKLFDLKHSNACIQSSDKVFCRAYIKLTPLNETYPSKNWKAIKKSKLKKFGYNYDWLGYGICIDNSIWRNNRRDLIQPTEYGGEHFKDVGLSSNVDELYCTSNSVQLNRRDFVTTSILVGYLVFILYATWKTKLVNQKTNKNKTKCDRVLSIFSLETTLKSLDTINNSTDFVKLKAIQGIRTLNMCLVMLCHISLIFLGLYINNPQFLEEVHSNSGIRAFFNIFIFMVQTNFMVSAWLLASQLYDLQKSNGKLSFKDICLIGLNRYLRLWPTMIFVILLYNNFVLYMIPLPYKALVELQIQKCENNWWPTLLFVENLYPGIMCMEVAWYVSVDAQLYMLSLIIFYLCFKFNYTPYKVIGFITITGFAIHLWRVTQFNIDALFLFTLKIPGLEHLFEYMESQGTYVSTLCNFGSYMVGLVFGGIYFYTKNESFKFSKKTTIIWVLTFLGFPTFVLYMTVCDNPKWIEILMSVFSKPLYSVGIGTGILGMSFGIGGIIKKLCEWEFLVKVANFNYSTFIAHLIYFLIVIYRSEHSIDLTIQYQLTEGVITITVGFLSGLVVYILVEQPFGQLQKMFIPRVRKGQPTKDVKSTQ